MNKCTQLKGRWFSKLSSNKAVTVFYKILYFFSIQDIFKWQLEVEDEGSNADTGRIVWSIEYERTSKQEQYISQESRINIKAQKQDNLVPVVKVSINRNPACYRLLMLTVFLVFSAQGTSKNNQNGGAN